MDNDGLYVQRLKRLFPNAAEAGDFGDNRYRQGSSKGPVSRCGIPSVDTDATVVYTCLRRMQDRVANESSHCPEGLRNELQLEMGLIKNSMDRILRTVRLPEKGLASTAPQKHSSSPPRPTRASAIGVVGVEEEGNMSRPRSAASAENEKVSPPVVLPKLYSRKRSIVESWADPEGLELRKKTSHGLWGLLIRHLQLSPQEYSFFIHRESLTGKRTALTKEATMFGLTNACDSIFRYRSMSVRIVRRDGASGGKGDVERGGGLIRYLRDSIHGQNIHEHKIVHVVASSCFGCSTVANLVDPVRVPAFITTNQPRSFVQIDFNDAVVIPTGYSMTSFHPIIAGFYPRSWVVTASIDGTIWDKLREHENDPTLTKTNRKAYWSLQTPLQRTTRPPLLSASDVAQDPFQVANRKYYRYIRWTQTDKNSFGQDDFQVTGLEVYGDMMRIVEFSKLPVLSRVPARPDKFLPPPPLPVEKVVQKGKK